GLVHVPNHLMPAVHAALTAWQDYLLGRSATVGPFEQHLLFFSPIESTNVLALSPYLNRYLLRTIDMDIVHAGNRAFVYSKMRRIAILGFIEMPDKQEWAATRIH